MKLRIRSNSIRLRLGQSEVRRLAETGSLEERTEFGPSDPPLVYALRADDSPAVAASFEQGRIIIRVPRATARQWASTEQVEIEGAQDTPSGESLRILIEKDFQCLDARSGESQEDAFPNPSGNKC